MVARRLAKGLRYGGAFPEPPRIFHPAHTMPVSFHFPPVIQPAGIAFSDGAAAPDRETPTPQPDS